MKKYIIAGGPHTGKTTLIEALQKKYPHFYFVPEPATLVIQETGVFPWEDYDTFLPLVIKKSFELESQIPSDTSYSIFDRCLVDNIAYSSLQDRADLHDDIWQAVQKAGYDQIFFCDFVGTYEQNEVRKESFETAQKIHAELQKAYKNSELPLIDIPNISVDERLELMKAYFDQ